MKFANNLKFGLIGERIVAEIMRARGWSVVQIGGQHGEYQGPRIELPMGLTLVSPDLIIMKGSNILWVEVKHKTQFSFHQNSKTITTGIDYHHWKQYLENDTYGSFPMWLFFVHEMASVQGMPFGSGVAVPEAGVYGGPVRWLSQNYAHIHPNFGDHGGIFWDAAKLKHLPLPVK